MSLGRAGFSAAKWTATSSVCSAVLQIVQLSILARILSPADYGLMAMVMFLVGFAQAYADMGLSNAIVYRQDATPEELSSLYWANILASWIVFAGVLSLMPFAVLLYDAPQLYIYVPLAASVFLFTPFGQQFQTLLQKELHFQTLAMVEIGAAATSLFVAYIFAAHGFGVVALIFGQLSAATITTLSFVIIGWSRWRPAFHFRWRDLDGYLSFGLYQMGERSLNFIASRTDQILIASILGHAALGYYSVAWNLVIQPVSKINPILTRVSFPLFARVQSENERLKRGYTMLLWIVAIVNAPILLGCAATAERLVPLLLGEKWMAAVPLVQILAIAGLLRCIGNPVGSLLLAMGRADLGFKWDLLAFLFQIPGVCLGAYVAGVYGVALSVAFLAGISIPGMYFLIVRTLLGPCLPDFVMSVLPGVVLATAMAVVVSLLPQVFAFGSLTALAMQIGAGAVIYVLSILLFQRGRLSRLLPTIIDMR